MVKTDSSTVDTQVTVTDFRELEQAYGFWSGGLIDNFLNYQYCNNLDKTLQTTEKFIKKWKVKLLAAKNCGAKTQLK